MGALTARGDHSGWGGRGQHRLAAILGLIVSGTYNLLTNQGHSPKYHMVFGVKILLVLHVFAVALLITQPKNPKRARMMTGTVISGLIILAISAYLRRIF